MVVGGVVTGAQELPDRVALGVFGHSINRDPVTATVELECDLAALADRGFFGCEDVELVGAGVERASGDDGGRFGALAARRRA